MLRHRLAAGIRYGDGADLDAVLLRVRRRRQDALFSSSRQRDGRGSSRVLCAMAGDLRGMLADDGFESDSTIMEMVFCVLMVVLWRAISTIPSGRPHGRAAASHLHCTAPPLWIWLICLRLISSPTKLLIETMLHRHKPSLGADTGRPSASGWATSSR